MTTGTWEGLSRPQNGKNQRSRGSVTSYGISTA